MVVQNIVKTKDIVTVALVVPKAFVPSGSISGNSRGVAMGQLVGRGVGAGK